MEKVNGSGNLTTTLFAPVEIGLELRVQHEVIFPHVDSIIWWEHESQELDFQPDVSSVN